MPLTTAQQTQIRNAVIADQTLNALPHTPDGAAAIAQALNLTDASNTQVWWSATPTANIINSITWANYTPNDAVPTSDALTSAIWLNRCMAAQTKQINLQNMIVGQPTLNTSLANVRAGLRDAVIQIPTGAGGAMTSPGGASGVTTLTACLRPTLATRAEKICSAGAQLTGTVTADVLSFEGQIYYQDVQAAMGWS